MVKRFIGSILWTISVGGLLLVLASCEPATSAPTAPLASIEPTHTVDTPQPSETPSPFPTVTPFPTASATDTPPPTLTPTPTHPLMIDVMRQTEYSGSEITFVEPLASGVNYSRYIVSYESEGNTIFALLTIPFGEAPPTGWPVIIFNHGYIPPEQYRTTERYVAYVDGFARNGYIVLRSDYRGHGSSEGEARGGYGTPDYTIDVLNAVASIKQHPDADPNRIGMWGHSMGGHITLRAMVVSNDIKAGVIWAGVVASYPDLITNWRRGPVGAPTRTPDPRWTSRGRWRTGLMDTYGSFEENPAFWASISPSAYITDLSGPLQLHHGTADTSVPVEFSQTLFDELLEARVESQLFLYPGDNHNISVNFSTAMARSIEFFNEHVKDSE